MAEEKQSNPTSRDRPSRRDLPSLSRQTVGRRSPSPTLMKMMETGERINPAIVCS